MEQADVRTLTIRYFRQVRELYGDEFIFSDPELKSKILDGNDGADLSAYETEIANCRLCDLSLTRNRLVFGSGNAGASLLLIGEAPGEDEDRQGKPFVGKAGQLLDKILAAIGFERDEIYIANILKCRPPGNRDPLPQESEVCITHLLRQINIIKPKIILTLGRIAAQTLLNSNAPLSRLRSSRHEFQGIPVIATYHPAALLRNPEWKRPAWEDVQKLRILYDQIVGDKGIWKPAQKN